MNPKIKHAVVATPSSFNEWPQDSFGAERQEKEMDGNYAEDDKRDFEEDSMESLTHSK
jgi:hypothetical protein